MSQPLVAVWLQEQRRSEVWAGVYSLLSDLAQRGSRVCSLPIADVVCGEVASVRYIFDLGFMPSMRGRHEREAVSDGFAIYWRLLFCLGHVCLY